MPSRRVEETQDVEAVKLYGDGLEIVLFLDWASSRSEIGESYEVFSPRPALVGRFCAKITLAVTLHIRGEGRQIEDSDGF